VQFNPLISVLYYGIGLWVMEFFQLISMLHAGYELMLIVENNRYELHLSVNCLITPSQGIVKHAR
jgi:hypothetical protein